MAAFTVVGITAGGVRGIVMSGYFRYVALVRVFITILLVFAAWSAQAQEAIVREVQDYFNTLTTYQAKFRQVDEALGLVQEGQFYLNRPKKFLWQYETPQRHKLVSTGSRLFYVDEESEQVTQLPLNIGLARVLTRRELDLADPQIQLLDVAKNDKVVSLTFQPPESESHQAARITLTLARDPLRLAQIVTTNTFGQKVEVTFYDIQQGQPLAAGLFNYVPPQEEDFLYN
jgi:outer membrane lipoprotein carrier protein